MTPEGPVVQPAPPAPVAKAPDRLRRLLCALWVAWATVGPVRPGHLTRTVPAADVLWALPWLGLGLGLLWTAIFAAAWRMFGEYGGLRLVPALAVVVADCLLSGRLLMAGVRMTEAVAEGDDQQLSLSRREICAAGAVAAALLLLVCYGLLLALPTGIEWWPADWRWHLRRLYPRPVFRPLVLMPLWACWGLVLAAGVGRARHEPQSPGFHPRGYSHQQEDPADRIAGQATPRQIFLGLALPAVLSAVYCSRDGNLVIGLATSLVVFLCVYAAAMAAALRWKGQNAVTVLASGLIGRTAFLLCWLFISRAVHGW